MTKTILAWVRFAFTAPWALVTWFLVTLFALCQLAELKKLKFRGAGILTTEWKPWFAKVYPFSLTLGRAMIFFPGDAPLVEKHEDRHIYQVEDLMVLSFLVGLFVLSWTSDPLLGFLLWLSGGIWQLPNFLTAILRYGHHATWSSDGSFFTKLRKFLGDLFVGIAYRDSEHERSAYAQTDPDSEGLSWDDRREKNR